jgi:hypothetical protein
MKSGKQPLAAFQKIIVKIRGNQRTEERDENSKQNSACSPSFESFPKAFGLKQL